MKQKIVAKVLYYALLTGVVFIAHETSMFLESMVVWQKSLAWLWLFLWYMAFIAIGDAILAYLFIKRVNK
jgi:hypothetical protein